MGCIESDLKSPSSTDFPQLDTLLFPARNQKYQPIDTTLTSIVPFFKNVGQSQENRNFFFDLMALKLGQLYSQTLVKLQNIIKTQKLSHDQIRVRFAKKILLSIIKTVGQLQKYQSWKKQRVSIFKGLMHCQKKIIDFLQYKYPRNRNNFTNAQLMQIFQNVNNSDHTDYDILINAGIFFDEELIKTFQRKYVITKIKHFINELINQTNKHYDNYKSQMEKLFDKLEGSFLISRKISEETRLYADDCQNFQITSPQIFRILLKWVQSLEDILLNTQQKLKKTKFLKIMEQSGQQISYFSMYTGKQQLISRIQSLLEKGGTQYRQQQQQHQSSLANFNDLVIQIINKNANQPQIDSNEIKAIKYSSYIGKFVEFLTIQKLVYLITQLTFKRSAIEKKCRKAVDLIRCDVMDLFRSRFMGTKSQLIKVFNRLKKLEDQNCIRIIRIKNRFQTPLNDALVNFVFIDGKNTFLPTQIQLVLIQPSSSQDSATSGEKINEEFNHILYECLRSIFGPIAEMSLMITYKDSLMGYEGKIKMEESCLSHMRCPQNDVLNCQYDLGIPYVCSLCNVFYPTHQNSFPINRCTGCNFYVCPDCLFDFDPQIRKQCYLKQIQIYIKENLHEIQETEQQNDFYFFDSHFQPISNIKTENKNIIDNLKDYMLKMDKKYACILQLQNGVRNIKCFTIVSGQILPTFYDYLPKSMRKKFKEEQFGLSDIILFFHPKIKIQSRSYDEDFIADCYRFGSNTQINRKVKEVYYFSWDNNNYLIDIGELMRDNNPNRVIKAQNLLANKELLQYYRKAEGKLELDYLDLEQINLKQVAKDLEGLRFIKLKSNHMNTIDNFLQFKRLQQINAQRNQIVNLNFGCELPKLRILNLSENFIETIKGINQNNLPSLKILDLSGNNIQVFPTIFLKQLSWLNLNSNKLDSLLTFKQSSLPKLKKLSISNNNIIAFPSAYFPTLKQIEAQDNKIEEISWVQCLPNLERLCLNKNKIKELCVIGLNHLDEIYLDDNEIEEVNAMAEWATEKLKVISLNGNHIEHLPVLKFNQLMDLSIQNNKLNSVQNLSLSQLQNLKLLDISSNNLQSFPTINMQLLEILNISKNQISDITNITDSHLPVIQEIDACHNCIKFLPQINSLTLEYLNLEDNEIRSMHQFSKSKLDSLRVLCLNKNIIKEFYGAQFPELQILYISDNSINWVQQISQSHYPNCKQIDLSKNQITSLPKLYMPSLQKLSLAHNRIEKMQGFEYSELSSLIQLDLKHNKLTHFMPTALPSLLTLKLSHNQLQSMEGLAQCTMQNVQEIDLYHNKIRQLCILKIPSLTFIDIGCNMIQEIDKLRKWVTPQIKQINLKNNKITELCSLNSKGLSQLNLSYNNITTIQQFCMKSQLPKLITLKLNNNKISGVLPRMLFVSLKKLQICENQLKCIDEFCNKSKAVKLNVLKLSGNQIEKLGYFQESFRKLKELYVNRNKVRELGEFSQSQLPYLRVLDLSNNSITYLQSFNFPGLNILSAANNSIMDLQYFEKSTLKSLQKLILSNNLITKWPSNFKLQKLNQLLIDNNNISDLSDFVESSLPEIEEIDLRKNKIRQHKKLQFSKLTHLWLAENLLDFDDLNSMVKNIFHNFGLKENKEMLSLDMEKSNRMSNHSSKRSSSKKIDMEQKKIKMKKIDFVKK